MVSEKLVEKIKRHYTRFSEDGTGVRNPEPFQILNPEGELNNGLSFEDMELGKEELLQIYKGMVYTRVFEEKAFNMQRQGKISLVAPSLGEEAVSVASQLALEKEDRTFPSYRQPGARFVVCISNKWGNYSLEDAMLRELWWCAGDQRANYTPKDFPVFPNTIPIATHLPHAVGYAMGNKIARENKMKEFVLETGEKRKHENMVALAYFGDGATSEGDFHEAMNFAGVYKSPVIFVCVNNQYAISVPRKRQTASETIAQKALAYGFEGMQVDGNDPLAIYSVTKYVAGQIRNGGNPFLIEALTYRLHHHTTADDWKRYRSEEEVERALENEPMKRFEPYLIKQGLINKLETHDIWEEAKEVVERAAAMYEEDAEKEMPISEIFEHVHAEIPWNLEEQLEFLKLYLKEQ